MLPRRCRAAVAAWPPLRSCFICGVQEPNTAPAPPSTSPSTASQRCGACGACLLPLCGLAGCLDGWAWCWSAGWWAGWPIPCLPPPLCLQSKRLGAGVIDGRGIWADQGQAARLVASLRALLGEEQRIAVQARGGGGGGLCSVCVDGMVVVVRVFGGVCVWMAGTRNRTLLPYHP